MALFLAESTFGDPTPRCYKSSFVSPRPLFLFSVNTSVNSVLSELVCSTVFLAQAE